MTIDWSALISAMVEFLKFGAKAALLVLASPYLSQRLSDAIKPLIDKWSAKKVEHIQLQASADDSRLLRMEDAIRDHKDWLTRNEKAIVASNEALDKKIVALQSDLATASIKIGGVSTELKASVESLQGNLVDRLSKDEAKIESFGETVKAQDAKITNFGKVIQTFLPKKE